MTDTKSIEQIQDLAQLPPGSFVTPVGKSLLSEDYIRVALSDMDYIIKNIESNPSNVISMDDFLKSKNNL